MEPGAGACEPGPAGCPHRRGRGAHGVRLPPGAPCERRRLPHLLLVDQQAHHARVYMCCSQSMGRAHWCPWRAGYELWAPARGGHGGVPLLLLATRYSRLLATCYAWYARMSCGRAAHGTAFGPPPCEQPRWLHGWNGTWGGHEAHRCGAGVGHCRVGAGERLVACAPPLTTLQGGEGHWALDLPLPLPGLPALRARTHSGLHNRPHLPSPPPRPPCRRS